ncbi:MAG: glycosyltransferase [Candidatus Dechloromonas phosphoritropha]
MTDIRHAQHSAPQLLTEVFMVYGSLRTGGIETLIVRVANFFVSSGARVSVCCDSVGELDSMLEDQVNVICYSETSDLIRSISAHLGDIRIGSHVLIMSFDAISAARGLMVETVFPKNLQVIHLSGIFHPRAYFMTSERADRVFLNHLVANAVGREQLYFMNLECRESHSKRWNADFSTSPVLALPINILEPTWQSSNKANVRVVSVGRLVDFKSYNLGVARIVSDCLNRGIQVTWDIYGDGPLRSLIEAEIETLGVAGNVRLMGVLEYSSFPEIVVNYDLFVGMGTAALEAAMLGVPTICVTIDEATRCYGYLHELPHGNVGELQEYPPTLELADLIQEYSESAQEWRSNFSQQCHAAAERYGIPVFAEALIKMAVNTHASPTRLVKRLVGELYCLATESYAVKAIRSHLSKRARSA